MKKNAIPAPVDGKNVCTDWIEDVFDNLASVKCDRQILGFIEDAPVYVYWEDNRIIWRCIECNGNYESIVNEIKSRLMNFEDPYSDLFELYTIGHSVVQIFYSRAD